MIRPFSIRSISPSKHQRASTSRPKAVMEPHTHTETHCTICASHLNTPRFDGSTEKAVILPCSHVFGSLCIARWLEQESLHKNCPNCRRRMIYRGCGHLVRPSPLKKDEMLRIEVQRVEESDMPDLCRACRSDGESEGGRRWREWHEKSVAALMGMKLFLPGVYGRACRETVDNVDQRVDELGVVYRRGLEGCDRW